VLHCPTADESVVVYEALPMTRGVRSSTNSSPVGVLVQASGLDLAPARRSRCSDARFRDRAEARPPPRTRALGCHRPEGFQHPFRRPVHRLLAVRRPRSSSAPGWRPRRTASRRNRFVARATLGHRPLLASTGSWSSRVRIPRSSSPEGDGQHFLSARVDLSPVRRCPSVGPAGSPDDSGALSCRARDFRRSPRTTDTRRSRFLVAGFHTRFVPPSPFLTTLTVYPSPSPPACFSRSRSWGVGTAGSTGHRAPGPSDPEVVRSTAASGLALATRAEGRRGGLASGTSPASRESWLQPSSKPSVTGLALCQALSRLTKPNAQALDATSAPCRWVETCRVAASRDPWLHARLVNLASAPTPSRKREILTAGMGVRSSPFLRATEG